jgi:hypothetical protein
MLVCPEVEHPAPLPLYVTVKAWRRACIVRAVTDLEAPHENVSRRAARYAVTAVRHRFWVSLLPVSTIPDFFQNSVFR